MDNEIYDDIEWEIDSFPSISSSGDAPDEYIHEFDAKGVDENGNKIHGTAFYTETFGALTFDYVEYDEIEEDTDDEEDEE